jgi:adenylate kinase
MNALIFGAPGSGKGTYSARLQDKLGVEVIAMGDIFRSIIKENTPLSHTVKSYVQAGLLVPDEIALEVVKDSMLKVHKINGFILDGYPRTLAQANALEKITHIDVVLQLCVPDWVIIERLSARRVCKNCASVYNMRFLKPKSDNVCDKCGGPLCQRTDDNEEVIKIRLELYERETCPLVRYYEGKKVPFISYTSEKLAVPPDEVVDFFLSELKKLKLI